MDASAIKAIRDLSVSEAGQLVLSAVDMLGVIVPDGHKLQSLEHLNVKPYLFRGQFKTNVIADFIRYIEDNASNDSAIFIDKDFMTAKGIIDFGTSDQPQWGKHVVYASLDQTPAYAALLKSADTVHKQQDFIDFSEDWQENIIFVDEQGNALDFRRTINTLRRIKVDANLSAEQSVGNFAASRSTLEQVEIKAGQDVLPAGFTFACIPYEGFANYMFDVQIRALNHEKEVKLKYRISRLAAKQTEIADEFKSIISDCIAPNPTFENVPIYLGNMAYQS